MNDPLHSQGPAQELFDQVAQLCQGKPQQLVGEIAVHLLVNVIRMSTPTRPAAEALWDELFGRGKTLLLDKHYDPVTGMRRTVFPFTQVAKATFHAEQNNVRKPT